MKIISKDFYCTFVYAKINTAENVAVYQMVDKVTREISVWVYSNCKGTDSRDESRCQNIDVVNKAKN